MDFPKSRQSERLRTIQRHNSHQIPAYWVNPVRLFYKFLSESSIHLIGNRLTRFANRIYGWSMSNPRRAVCTMRVQCRLSNRLRSSKAFSLVEVVLAIGVVSFAMMAMLGTLPVGLKSSQQSRGQVATANISRQLQGELQQISFNDSSKDTLTVEKLADNPFYYTLEGTKTDADGAYYIANFSVTNVSLPGLAVDASRARNVKVTLSYPANAPVESRQESVFSLLLAKQKTD